MTYLIRDMPVHDRPRERMFKHGAKTLSDAELLAVILGTGAAGKNAIHLAQELLIGGICSLRNRDFTTLAGARGVGPAKIARIGATLELARRMSAEPKEKVSRYDSATLGRQLVAGISHFTQEHFGVALLDARQRIVRQQELFIGTLDKTAVSTREVIRVAMIEHAKGVVVYHNHPSGDPTPSRADIDMTREIVKAAGALGLVVHDHLIVGRGRHASFKSMGLL